MLIPPRKSLACIACDVNFNKLTANHPPMSCHLTNFTHPLLSKRRYASGVTETSRITGTLALIGFSLKVFGVIRPPFFAALLPIGRRIMLLVLPFFRLFFAAAVGGAANSPGSSLGMFWLEPPPRNATGIKHRSAPWPVGIWKEQHKTNCHWIELFLPSLFFFANRTNTISFYPHCYDSLESRCVASCGLHAKDKELAFAQDW